MSELARPKEFAQFIGKEIRLSRWNTRRASGQNLWSIRQLPISRKNWFVGVRGTMALLVAPLVVSG